MINITPVVLCGGTGSRLWPLSRAGMPKQFLVLSGNFSLFQEAVRRINALGGAGIALAQTLAVTNEEHRFLALEQLRELRDVQARLLLEPAGRNTAPALTMAALQAREEGADPVLVVVPADHAVADQAAFTQALQQAIRVADQGGIVVLGVQPDRPETGYGYIRSDGAPGAHGEYRVGAFVEKPDLATARGYLEAGNYLWNSGMFVLRASVWLEAIGRFRPDIAGALQGAWETHGDDGQFIRPGKDAFLAAPGESIDYAVIEQCPAAGIPISMVPIAAGWSDLGAWDAVWGVSARDGDGNATFGDVLAEQSRDCLVHASSRLVATVGVDNLIVVETPDAVLVAERSRSQEVKELVARLNLARRDEHLLHRKVNRPWGWYDSIDEDERFKVKRIQVKPNASLSLQMHHHRAEHWIVVRGTAEVTCGDKVTLLSENESTYIPLGAVHRLRNPGTIPLEIIEVQSGSYLGEDDIVRYEDTYGRAG
ncbi:mannose-1-phosphate guanylyltransferase/mannose-6-phosphate isomerase [Massilia sp. SYSU DXS3249]